MAVSLDITLKLWEVRYKCGGVPGSRRVWAPSSRAASRVLREHPSSFGLAHETVIVVAVRELHLRPAGIAA